MPGNTLSLSPHYAPFVEQTNKQAVPLIDYEMGGIELGNPGQGLSVKLWTLKSDGHNVTVEAADVAPVTLFTRVGNVTEVSLAFDQNMRTYVAFVEDGLAWLWWWDTSINAMTFTNFPGIITPRIGLDEKRATQSANSDVIFAYAKGSDLCYRQQRERFGTERTLKVAANVKVVSIGMNKSECFMFKTKPFG